MLASRRCRQFHSNTYLFDANTALKLPVNAGHSLTINASEVIKTVKYEKY